MMKKFFFFPVIYAVGWLLLPAESSYAQPDTLSLELKNIPVYQNFESRDPFFGDEHHRDSLLYSRKLMFLFDSVEVMGNSVVYTYIHDSIRFKNYFDTSCFLKITYDSVSHILIKIHLTFLTSFHDLKYPSSGYDSVIIDLENFSVSRKGPLLRGYLNSTDELLHHSFLYTNDSLYFDEDIPSTTTTTDTFALWRKVDSSSFRFSLSTMAFLDVPSNFPKDYRIFPNPASTTVSLQLANQQEKDITIFDILGRNILSYKLEPGELTNLDISSLPPGIYYLRAGNQMQKFVIAR